MDSVAGRAYPIVLLGAVVACTAAIYCVQPLAVAAPDDERAPAGLTADFPIASDVRLAGDEKRTRFILDLDRNVQFRAFALADPYRVIVDLPQVTFQLAARAGAAGRGLIKAFRYGLVMPGGSRIVFDLAGPAKLDKSYVLDAANGQPPRLVLEFEAVDRTTFVQGLAAESRPDLRPAIGTSDGVASAAVVATAVADATGTAK